MIKENIEVLKEKPFDEKNTKKIIKEKFDSFKKTCEELNSLANKKNIYITINERQEKEKLLRNTFPYLNNYHQDMNVYDIDKLMEDVKYAYDRRFKHALDKINFVSLNEKSKKVKVSSSYGYIHLYPLRNVAKFITELKDEDITIIKKYSNGNMEFVFNNEYDYELFKEIVFYHTETTETVINNAPKEIIEKYKAYKKEKWHNESSVIYEWASEQKLKNLNSINYNLINKAWKC